MEVNPNLSALPVQKVAGRSAVTPRPKPAGTDSVSFREAEAVDGALKQTPDVRPEAVAMARMLGVTVKYPPLDMIQAIAKLLAMKMDDNQQASSQSSDTP
jgi:hypothetical protein